MVIALTTVLVSKPMQCNVWVMLVKVEFYNNLYDLHVDDETFNTWVKLNCLHSSINQ